MIFQFQPIPPYDFALTARASRYYATIHTLHDGGVRRVLRVGDGLALVHVTGHGTTDAPLLRAEVVASEGVIEPARLEAALRHWLALDADLRPFYAAAQADAALAETVTRLWGLHILRTESVFEALMVTMIEQQIALRAAQLAERWLIATYGDQLMYDGREYRAFPAASRLAALAVEDLTPLKITFIRMGRMLAIARGVVEGVLNLEVLRALPTDEAYRALVALNGIGHWTAAWSMIRALGTYIYVGSADVALRAAVNHYWRGQPGRAERAETDALFATYGDYAGQAAVYTLMRWGTERYPNMGDEPM